MLLSHQNKRLYRNVVFVLTHKIKQLMRRKILLLLAVPALFLMTMFFMMSDIKEVPATSIDTVVVQPRPQLLQRIPNPNKRPDPKLSQGKDQPPAKNPLDHSPNPPSPVTEAPRRVDNDEDNEHRYALPDSTPPADNQGDEKGTRTDANPPATGVSVEQMRAAVVDAYKHAFKSYEAAVWGHDELRPMSRQANDWLHMGLSIVDSLDTMWLMGLEEEYKKSRAWVETYLNFDAHAQISVFETTIRVVGGLVSIYDLTGDAMYLTKATELGRKLMPAFNTPTGIAYTTIDISSGSASNPHWNGGASVLSEAGTLQVEFAALSRHSGVNEFAEKALKIIDVMDRVEKLDGGLYPVYIDPNSGEFRNRRVTLGALGDSWYEYLLKLWIVTGKSNEKYRRMYEEAAQAIITHLVKKSTPSGLTYIAEKDGNIVDKMDHLVCFAGAMFALGAHHNATKDTEAHMLLGKEITRTCHEFYVRQPTGLSPELVKFTPGGDFYSGANHYILRPETVESYFVLYWLTGDTTYQEWGWEAFQAMETYCRTPEGYTGIRDVTSTNSARDDLQQSFFMAETLKYLYLLFSPRDTLSLDEYVFNTEAHPIKVFV